MIDRLLDEIYAGPAWHGPAVREALADVTAPLATKKLSPDRNSIWELVLHLAHGRHLLIERLENATIDEFPRPLREPWWPVPPSEPSEAAWRSDLALLDEYHAKLTSAIRRASPSQLARIPLGSKISVADQLVGMAVHDGYHAGQIRLLALELDVGHSAPSP